MKEALEGYIKRVSELADHVKGNEQATKQSLIGPLFTLLGYDLTDPRQCVPEYKCDFGEKRSVKPIDWAFLRDGKPIAFVEAKEVGKKLTGFVEQLADYFAKSPEAKLGILTNGVQWRFYTDLVHANVMDKEPFLTWEVLAEPPPISFLMVLQKTEYNPGLMRTFAQKTHQHNLLLGELTRILEPTPEFTKMAIQNLETRNLTAAVVDTWKPVVASAIIEWANQRALTSVIGPAAQSVSGEEAGAKGATTQEELESFALVQRLLGSERPVTFDDATSYFKIHLPERKTWVICRLYLGRKRPTVWVPLPLEQVTAMVPSDSASTPQSGWSCITLDAPGEIEKLGDVLRAAWDHVKTTRGKSSDDTRDE